MENRFGRGCKRLTPIFSLNIIYGMSLWNKILLGLLFVASLVFFHAALRTLKTYKSWAAETDRKEKQLAKVRGEIVCLRLANGKEGDKNALDDKGSLGVEQLRIKLARRLANRGRVWKGDKQKFTTAPTGFMTVNVGSDDCTAFDKHMLVYAFEEGDEQSPGKYLGEYRVDNVGEKERQVVLVSTGPLTNTGPIKSTDPKSKTLADNVAESKAPWVLYEMMPTDEHEVFESLSEDQRKWASDEYFNDGKFIDANGKVSQNPKDKKFIRPLRDYLTIFRACDMHRTLFADRFESATRNLGNLEESQKEAASEEALVEKEKTQVEGELKRAQTEKAAVANLLTARQTMASLFQAAVQKAIAENLESAQKIARLQKEAADEIDRRTRAMAQIGVRTN